MPIQSDSDLGDTAVNKRDERLLFQWSLLTSATLCGLALSIMTVSPLLNSGHKKCLRKYKNRVPFKVPSKLNAVSISAVDKAVIILVRLPFATGCSS